VWVRPPLDLSPTVPTVANAVPTSADVTDPVANAIPTSADVIDPVANASAPPTIPTIPTIAAVHGADDAELRYRARV